MIPGTSFWSKLRRWFLGTRIASRKHPFTQYFLKSTQTIDYEISQQLKFYPNMIHPFSTFRIFWESAMTLFIIAALMVTPVFLAFYFDEPEKWYFFNHAIDSVFICDIVIWFFTGYYDCQTQLIILNPKIVASEYLRSFFVIDVLPVLPLEFFIVLFKSMWYLAALNLLKILWMRTLIKYSRRLYYIYEINFHLYKVAEISVIIIVCVHWAACLEYYLPLAVAKMVGQNDALSQLSQFMMTIHSTRKRHLQLIEQLQQYMTYKELPYSLQQRLLSYYDYRNKKGFERNKIIINHVSPYLREKLLLHNYRRLLNDVDLFRNLPGIVVAQFVSAVRSEIFMSNDVLIRAGARGDALYFIAYGTVVVYNSAEKEICHLEDGAYFGELALLMEDERWIASVIAAENCEVHILSRADFQNALMSYPNLLAHLQNVMLARLEQTPLLEKVRESDSPMTMTGNVNISSIKIKKKD
ncbi:PREDICTED: potassium/sodium hyperpolarization-activated cyclic nucleotide-gated channel 2-like [Trachymyrmex septentrionalis]|uniref:potassium/sodium hyperpolarization-activated cyclic nucleotide-gated channel 2-like n=1 Tax=Trachymyrmex septentrionalis TaxID=34720 RepID=UPI00084F6B90|nr:PREDICTED: potassium/sodium hyperpolarization-activated cyclic nucleotide-gated channel 2-like [Trachymyrmex septentrionalis]